MRTLFEQIARHERRYWELTTLFHVPNERADKGARIKLAGLGVRAGIPDVLSPVQKRRSDGRLLYRGFALELKRERDGLVEPAQAEWLDLFRWMGWYASVQKGWRPAWNAICEYYDLPERLRA